MRKTNILAMVLAVVLVLAAFSPVVLATGVDAGLAEEDGTNEQPGKPETPVEPETPDPTPALPTPPPMPDPTPTPAEPTPPQKTAPPQPDKTVQPTADPQAVQTAKPEDIDIAPVGGKVYSTKNIAALFVDEAGKPISGMKVEAGAEGMAVTLSKTTDAKGEIKASGLPYGSVTLSFDKEGISPLVLTLEQGTKTQIGQTTENSVVLVAAPGAKNLDMEFEQQGNRFVLRKFQEAGVFGVGQILRVVIIVAVLAVAVIIIIAVVRRRTRRKVAPARRHTQPVTAADHKKIKREDFAGERRTGGQSKLNQPDDDPPKTKFGDRQRM